MPAYSDIDAVLRRARVANVNDVLCTGTSITSVRDTLQYIRQANGEIPRLYLTVGVHPTETKPGQFNSGAVADELKRYCLENADVVRAFGEYGLDKARTEFADFDTQLTSFQAQLQLNEYLRLPSFFHCRDAEDEFFATLDQFKNVIACGGVCHSFTGNPEAAQKSIERQLAVGFNGCSLRSVEMLELMPKLPVESILLETDAPYCIIKPSHPSAAYVKTLKLRKTLKPKAYKALEDKTDYVVSARNEPCLLPIVAECVYSIHSAASDRQISYFDFCAIIRNTVRAIFKF